VTDGESTPKAEPTPPGEPTPPAEPAANGDKVPEDMSVGELVFEVSDRASVLIREEIELAKTEVTEKVTRLIRGAIVGVAAGVFVVMALVFALVGCAWLLYYYLPGNNFTYFWGFFAMAVILLVLGALAGLLAARAVKRGTPPVPSMAIEEAQKIRETVGKVSDAPPPTSAPGASS
jgi:uncharacterized membrane protein YqjE